MDTSTHEVVTYTAEMLNYWGKFSSQFPLKEKPVHIIRDIPVDQQRKLDHHALKNMSQEQRDKLDISVYTAEMLNHWGKFSSLFPLKEIPVHIIKDIPVDQQRKLDHHALKNMTPDQRAAIENSIKIHGLETQARELDHAVKSTIKDLWDKPDSDPDLEALEKIELEFTQSEEKLANILPEGWFERRLDQAKQLLDAVAVAYHSRLTGSDFNKEGGQLTKHANKVLDHVRGLVQRREARAAPSFS